MNAASGMLSARSRRAPRRWSQVERQVLEVAARQHGIVTRPQLLELGASPDAVDRRLATGWLERMHRGVYRVGPVAARHSREMAAVLACGDGAVVSHRWAVALWGLLPRQDRGELVDIALRVGCRRRPGIRIHRPARLGDDETTILHRVPVTTAARTLYDIAGSVPSRELEQAVAEALATGVATRRQVVRILARHPGRRGALRLHGILSARTAPARTRSVAEEVFLVLVRRAGLPEPEVNVMVSGYEVDFRWPAERLVVEIDGYAYHSSRRKFEVDRRRDAELSGAGELVMRVTWDQLQDEREAVLARLVRALERRGRGR